MWLLKMQRFVRVKLALAALMMAALIVVCGHTFAQLSRAEQSQQSDRDERRTDRRVDGLQKDFGDLKLNLETRLVKIETYLNALTYLLGALVVAVAGQIGAAIVKCAGVLLKQRGATDKPGAG